MRRSALCLVAGLLLLGGCSDADPDEAADTVPSTTTTVPTATTTATSPPSSVGPPGTAPPPPPVSIPPPTVSLEPTVDLCTEAMTVASDVELTFEEAASHLEGLAARAADPALADELRTLASAFRAGSAPSSEGLQALCA